MPNKQIPKCLYALYEERALMRLILSPKEFKGYKKLFNSHVDSVLKEEQRNLDTFASSTK